jgi:hypothetical protein
MSALIEAFANGGLWMYVIVIWGGAFYGLLCHQYVRREHTDFTWALWGLLLSLALLGPLGSTVGIYQASVAVAAKEGLAATEAVQLVSTYIGIASTTTIFSTLLAVIGAVALGLVTHRVRNPRRLATVPMAEANMSLAAAQSR